MPSISDLQSYASGAATNAGIDPNVFLWQIGQESSWNPNAQNGNAVGLGQFMPRTANMFGINPRDPYQSLDAAAQYDSQLLNKCGGNYTCALTKYGTLANVPSSVMSKFQNVLSGAVNPATQQQNPGVKATSDSFVSKIAYLLLGVVIIAGAIWTYHKS